MMQKFKMEIQEFNALFNEKYPREDVLKQYTNPEEGTLEQIKETIDDFQFLKENQNENLKNISVDSVCFKGAQGQVFKQVYTFSIKGVKKSEQIDLSECQIRGKIYFPNSFPNKTPTVIVDQIEEGKPLMMVHLYTDGCVCHPSQKKKQKSIANILTMIESVIYNPNEHDGANIVMQDMYRNNKEDYWKFQREQAHRLGQMQKEMDMKKKKK